MDECTARQTDRIIHSDTDRHKDKHTHTHTEKCGSRQGQVELQMISVTNDYEHSGSYGGLLNLIIMQRYTVWHPHSTVGKTLCDTMIIG